MYIRLGATQYEQEWRLHTPVAAEITANGDNVWLQGAAGSA